MKLDRRTRKLYYDDFFLSRADARVVKVGPDVIELDATVAFPEGGGQEADHGTLTLDDGRVLHFDWATKMYAHTSGLPEFPDVQVEGVIWHRVAEADRPQLATVRPGQAVSVAIDVARRARLTLSHTASHLLYLGIGAHRPDAIAQTIGCHIKPDGARFDFSVDERFSPEDVARIEATANTFVQRDTPVWVSAHPTTPDARLWHCDGHTIPCGGTHLDHTAAIGPLTVRRRGLGTGKERLSCTFDDALPDLARYHA